MKSLSMLFVLLLASQAFAQEKIEIEKRVNADEVPQLARSWFEQAYTDARKVNWYYEESTTGTSYEAKVNYKGRQHSVEFSEEGILEDIEVITSWKELPKEVREEIEEYFENEYDRYKLRRIQTQFSGSSDGLKSCVQKGVYDDLKVKYEIEFYGKNDTENALWEGLFDGDGKLVQRREIILKPTNNLDFR